MIGTGIEGHILPFCVGSPASNGNQLTKVRNGCIGFHFQLSRRLQESPVQHNDSLSPKLTFQPKIQTWRRKQWDFSHHPKTCVWVSRLFWHMAFRKLACGFAKKLEVSCLHRLTYDEGALVIPRPLYHSSFLGF